MPPGDTHPGLVVHTAEPLNAGPRLDGLAESFVTPADRFFVRNHGPIPEVDPDRYRLRVGGMVERSLELSLDEIRRMPATILAATLQCAGNRRRDLLAIAPIPGEIPWDAGAIGTAVWTGVPLREVLRAAGPDPAAGHVAFAGLDDDAAPDRGRFGGSIPIDKASGGEVLLAYEMNGAPLAPAHGFPLRVVVPGYIGARSVKWLASITVQAEPSASHFQRRAYRLFPPHVDAASAGRDAGLMLGEVPVNAAICRPAPGERVPAGVLTVLGYAIGGRPIERVDLRVNGRWIGADLLGEPHRWAWRLWQAGVPLAPGPCDLAVRAWDAAAQTQPEEPVWNLKGYVNNAWHRVRVEVV